MFCRKFCLEQVRDQVAPDYPITTIRRQHEKSPHYSWPPLSCHPRRPSTLQKINSTIHSSTVSPALVIACSSPTFKIPTAISSQNPTVFSVWIVSTILDHTRPARPRLRSNPVDSARFPRFVYALSLVSNHPGSPCLFRRTAPTDNQRLKRSSSASRRGFI
jgi:hypothetical protein